jgi:hypothetical protein
MIGRKHLRNHRRLTSKNVLGVEIQLLKSALTSPILEVRRGDDERERQLS